MKYIVMESHLSYAVLLGDDGRFIKAANMHYEVGQIVTDVIEMKEVPVKKVNRHLNTILAAAVACLIFFVSSAINNQTYASVFMVINPEVRIDVNRKNVVVGLEGMNIDGEDLIEGYSYKNKTLEPVMDELLDRAMEMGYLSDGEEITLTLDAPDNTWVTTTGTELQTHMDEYLTDDISIHIEISNPELSQTPAAEPEDNVTDTPQTVVIPTIPDDGDSNYGESDYGDWDEDTDDDSDDEDHHEDEEDDTNNSEYEDHSSDSDYE